MRKRTLAIAVAIATLAAVVTAVALADGTDNGFKTGQPPMLTTGDRADVTFTPLITVGETLGGGYRFEAIPDGISLRPRGNGRVDLYVNHETSTVPFPYVAAAPTAASSQNDFDNAQVSILSLHQHSAGIFKGDFAISSAEGFQRFCSNYLATSREGFDRDVFFTNEEAVEWVNTSGTAWPSAQGADGARQSGAVVATDGRNGKHHTIWGMGRFNHENDVAVPGFDDLVVLSGDDPFTSNPKQSQLYAYIAKDTTTLLNDEGDLWAFVSDDPAVDDYYDFPVNSTMTVSGHFAKVPKNIATGRDSSGRDLLAATSGLGIPAPPNDGTWTRDAAGLPVDGPQWVLDQWGNAPNNAYGQNVFRFVRIEDVAYDKRPGMSNVVYLADSGRNATSAGGNAFTSSNGRVWKLVLDPSDPTRVLSLSILVEGDDNPVASINPAASFREVHQPDNLETTANGSLLVQEDPGGVNTYALPAGPDKTTARIWRVPLGSPTPDGSKEVVAKIDQSADNGPTDVDGATAPANLGAWESSGIIDASSVFGPGAFLADVQAHSLWVEKADGPDLTAPAGPDWTFKREGGQLILIRIPGA